MRLSVVLELIRAVRASGYAPYAKYSDERIAERIRRVYPKESENMEKVFVPKKVKEAIARAHRLERKGPSLVQEKNQTPSEPVAFLEEVEAGLKPLCLSATSSAKSSSTVFEEHGGILSRYGLHVETGSTMLNQFEPSYLGLANPFTLPIAVGGPDIPGHDRWRRPTAREVDAVNARIKADFKGCLLYTSPSPRDS